MALPLPIDQFPKILVHGDEQPILRHGSGQDLVVEHRRIEIPDGKHIVAKVPEQILNRDSDSHIRDESQPSATHLANRENLFIGNAINRIRENSLNVLSFQLGIVGQ